MSVSADKLHSSRDSTAHNPAQTDGLRPAWFFVPDFEREISKLDGVTAARVVSIGSQIDEIHVLALPNRPPKKIVRDIESLLLVRYGIRIDHRCISIVQSNEKQALSGDSTRIQIRQVRRKHDRIEVTALSDGAEIIGVALLDDTRGETQAVAWAMIHVIEQMLNTSAVLTLEDVQVCPARASSVSLVLLRWQFAGQEELFVGAALVTDELDTSVARAVLDAVNRRLVRLHDAAKQNHSGL